MAVFNLRNAFKSWGIRIKKVKKLPKPLTRGTANRIVKRAKKLAPNHTGETKKGIRRRKKKKGHMVESWVPGRFKQNLFANRTRPFDRLSFGEKSNSLYFANSQSVTYGRPAESPSGNPINWTGKPQFFNLAVLKEGKKAPRRARRKMLKSLRFG